MTREEIALVQSSWEKIRPISEDAAEIFYLRLFDIAPELKSLFQVDLRQQGQHLVQMLNLVVNGLEGWERLVPTIEALGLRHARYGVAPVDYDAVGSALLWTLEQGLGEAFSDELKQAWIAAYGLLSDTMKKAGERSRRSARRSGRRMQDPDDDRRFEARFHAAAISSDEWTHEAHLRMAFLLLQRHEFREAVRRIRRGIRRLNRANGIVDSETEGYHETITLAWARVVAATLAEQPSNDDFAAFIARNPALLDQGRILLHYSRERIGSARARREFVLPDRSPLPATPDTVWDRSARARLATAHTHC